MSRNHIIFGGDKDTILLALPSVENDVKRCLTEDKNLLNLKEENEISTKHFESCRNQVGGEQE